MNQLFAIKSARAADSDLGHGSPLPYYVPCANHQDQLHISSFKTMSVNFEILACQRVDAKTIPESKNGIAFIKSLPTMKILEEAITDAIILDAEQVMASSDDTRLNRKKPLV